MNAPAQDIDSRSLTSIGTAQGGRARNRAEAEAAVETLLACLGDAPAAQARLFSLARGK